MSIGNLVPVFATILVHIVAPSPLSGCQESPATVPTLSVRDVKMDSDGNWVPDHLGEVVTTEGVVTYEPYLARSGEEIRAYMEDASAGIRLILPDTGLFTLGDRVRVTGEVEQYHGMGQIRVRELEVLETGIPLFPRDLLATDLGEEAYEGRLVRMEGLPEIGADRIHLRDRTGSVRIYFRSSVFSPEDLTDPISEGRPTLVVGILEQYDDTDPMNGGYRLTPRVVEDVSLAPPDRTILYLTVFLILFALTALTLGLRQWIWKRNARKWKKISDDLRKEILEQEAVRQALEVRYQEARRLEAVGRLAGGVAHVFNNLLTVITGNSSAQLADPEIQGEDREAWEAAGAAASRAGKITESLLAFGRVQAVDLEPLSLEAYFENREEELRNLLGNKIHLGIQSMDGVRVEIDPTQFSRVIHQILANGRDTQPDGGEVTITWDRLWVEEGGIPDGLDLGAGPYIVMTVEDGGPGVGEEESLRIFEPFYSTKEGALGMGLAEVYGIMNQCGGAVCTDSTGNKGLRLRLYMPTPRVHKEIPQRE